MSIGKGTKLGPYEILSMIGAGGMGEVYKASDTRLNRTVAIKVLPQHFSENVEMKQRFEREAQTIAALNHPHICTLHDVGKHEGMDFLVMEFLEGETLAHRLERGALPLEETLRIAIEMADALDKAHRQGVVHRDLKPSNVMLTKSGTKLLDFGLAKLKSPEQVPTISTLPTRADVTAQGTILGTLQYMAPEQLEAKDADSRTDIFSFGAILYEMATGRKAFEGKSQASLITAIMSAQPQPLSKMQPMTPPALDHVVARCLEKDPEQRWQTAVDLLAQLRWVLVDGSQAGMPVPVASQRRKRETLPWLLSAMLALLVAAMATPTLYYFRGPTPSDQIRFFVAVPPMAESVRLRISPNGRWLAFVATGSASPQAMFIRPIGSTAAQELPGTDGANSLFWSPDSRFIGFSSGQKLKKIDLAGGPPQNLADVTSFRGGAWNDEGVILFGSPSGLYRISAAVGGQPVQITTLDASRKETSHDSPHFLPDRRHFLYTAWSSEPANRVIYLASLDDANRTEFLAASSMAVYADPGYILFHREGTLFAQRIDTNRQTLAGESVRLADDVAYSLSDARGAFSASNNGLLAYRSGADVDATSHFVWFDRSGRQLGDTSEPGPYAASFDLSPDEKQIAAVRRDQSGNRDIWTVDWSRNVSTRITFDPANEGDPIWSPDGSRIVFDSKNDLFEKNASGVGDDKSVLALPNNQFSEDWSKDGRYIAYVSGSAPNPVDIHILPLFGDRKPFPLIQSPFRKDEPHFSFDGKWLAYASNESGTWQIYVVSFPTPDQKRQISTNGGSQPRWRKDGKELFYLAADGKMMAVDIRAEGRIDSGIPRALFDTGLTLDPIRDQYAVTSDGQRFLLLKPVTGATPTPITVVVNWHNQLN